MSFHFQWGFPLTNGTMLDLGIENAVASGVAAASHGAYGASLDRNLNHEFGLMTDAATAAAVVMLEALEDIWAEVSISAVGTICVEEENESDQPKDRLSVAVQVLRYKRVGSDIAH